MPRFGRPNATGRSSGKLSGRACEIFGPPKDKPWFWLPCELLASPAWRLRGINCARLIDFLLVEHRNHAGRENGNLMATYDQLVGYGLSRRLISHAIAEAEFLGLLRVDRGGRWANSNQPSTFRLTFYANRQGNPPTNEWSGKTAEAIREWKTDKRRRRQTDQAWRKKQKPAPPCDTTVVPLLALRNDGKIDG